MIHVPYDQASKKATEANLERMKVERTDDPPPLYLALDYQVALSSTPPIAQYLPDIKPSNFIYLSRANSSVKGTWVLNPSLSIPSTFPPSLVDGEKEETRKNLWLDSKNGSINGDIYILPSSGDSLSVVKHRQRIFISATSRNGSVTTKLHDVQSQNQSERRLPLQISCSSVNGNVNIYLPRSFVGPLQVKTRNGSLRFSDPVKQLLTPFSEMGGAQWSFLGDFDSSKWEKGGE